MSSGHKAGFVLTLYPVSLKGGIELSEKDKVRLVVNCLWDGASWWAIEEAHTPVLDHLVERGLFSSNVRAVLTTISPTTKASLRTGLYADGHWAVPFFDLERGRRDETCKVKSDVPSLHSILAAHGFWTVDFDFCTVVMMRGQSSPLFRAHEAYNYKEVGKGFEAGSQSFDAVLRWVREELPARLKDYGKVVLSFELASPDNTSGVNGSCDPAYRFAITFVDTCMGLIIEELERQGLWGETFFSWSVDHGIVDVRHPAFVSELEGALKRRGIPFLRIEPFLRFALVYLPSEALKEEAAEALREVEWVSEAGPVERYRMRRPKGGEVVVFLKEGYNFGIKSELPRPVGAHGGCTEVERHTAFLFHCPGLVGPGRVDQVVEQVSFLPTFLNLLGLSPPGGTS